jgi:dTDP-4-dehydrorhamnose reductase
MVNAGTSSRYDVAVAMCDIINRPDIEIEPVSSAYFPLPAPRARSEAMRNYKLELLGLNSMRSWREALEEYMLEELMQGLEK